VCMANSQYVQVFFLVSTQIDLQAKPVTED